MNISLHRAAAIILCSSLIAGLPVASYAQALTAMPPDQQIPAPPPPMQGQMQAAPAQQQAPSYSQGQIDQLLAPIALYPDELVGQILMASTYPLEVVEAGRWLQDPNNAALHGDQLTAALQQQSWDPSVKSLVAFPQVLQTMNSNLQWTEQLGDAFLAQQPDVMNGVQRLRQQAQAAGNLASTPQQTVATQGSDIVIQPAQPQVVYVPVYNPQVVYGSWGYPAYPPYYFPGYAYAPGVIIGFGLGIAVVDGLWGWWHWDWYHHHIDVVGYRYAELNRGFGPAGHGDVWAHDVAHRRGVPYRDAATRERFLGAAANSPEARRTFRGFPAAQAQNRSFSNTAAHATAFNSARVNGAAAARTASPAAQHSFAAPQAHRQAAATQRPVSNAARSFTQQRAAPFYESFARGSEVQAQSARGASSRSSAASHAPAQAPRMQAPHAAATSAHVSGGGHGGGGNNVRH